MLGLLAPQNTEQERMRRAQLCLWGHALDVQDAPYGLERARSLASAPKSTRYPTNQLPESLVLLMKRQQPLRPI